MYFKSQPPLLSHGERGNFNYMQVVQWFLKPLSPALERGLPDSTLAAVPVELLSVPSSSPLFLRLSLLRLLTSEEMPLSVGLQLPEPQLGNYPQAET